MVEGVKLQADRNLVTMAVLFLIFAFSLFSYPSFSGMLLILSIFVFGGLALMWKEPNVKMAGLGAIVLLAVFNIAIHGMQFGIDFSGGTKIPILLERSVDTQTMNELMQTIKKRVSVLGLTEAKVRAVGSTEIDVEVPGTDSAQVQFIQDTLSKQGVFYAVVDGKLALEGSDLFTASVAPISTTSLQTRADWGVQFSIKQTGAKRFAEVAKGKANYPLYMFIDRPDSNASVFVSLENLRKEAPEGVTDTELFNALREAVRLDEDPMNIYVVDTLNFSAIPTAVNSTAVVSKDVSQEFKTMLLEKGYKLREVELSAMVPAYGSSSLQSVVVDKWEAAGLLSMAILSSGVTQGVPINAATISGSISNAQGTQDIAKLANENVKRIESILKGGALPVQISLGSSTFVPPSLGQEFLTLSLIGILAALAAISIFMGIRYQHLYIVLPIVAISISEFIILLSILGSFTIDLAAMAGIMAAIGVGVDAQIVITDELLKKASGNLKEKMDYAFAIIKTNVLVAVVAMIPLLFSGLVEVIGFAISTILGAMLGFLISRPAYAVLAEKILSRDEQQPKAE